MDKVTGSQGLAAEATRSAPCPYRRPHTSILSLATRRVPAVPQSCCGAVLDRRPSCRRLSRRKRDPPEARLPTLPAPQSSASLPSQPRTLASRGRLCPRRPPIVTTRILGGLRTPPPKLRGDDVPCPCSAADSTETLHTARRDRSFLPPSSAPASRCRTRKWQRRWPP